MYILLISLLISILSVSSSIGGALIDGKLKNKPKKSLIVSPVCARRHSEQFIQKMEKDNMHKGLQETDNLGSLEKKKCYNCQ